MTAEAVRTLGAALLLFAGGLVVACDRPADRGDVLAYACPMRCEEDKVYDQPGSCPVCGMDLVVMGEDGTLVMPASPEPGPVTGGQ